MLQLYTQSSYDQVRLVDGGTVLPGPFHVVSIKSIRPSLRAIAAIQKLHPHETQQAPGY
jgi:hypothetical protein